MPATLAALRQSSATARQKAKFILATDGQSFEAENLADGETVACAYADFHDHFGFFLPLAGITTVKQIRENAFDIKATSRLNRLYIELLKDNPEWATAARREDLNHFMARLIFCFFAEDTAIFHGDRLFTGTIEQMTARDSSDTHQVLSELFRAMNTRLAERDAANIRSWAHGFPYVNGGLFGRPGSADVPVGTPKKADGDVGAPSVPRFSKIARSQRLARIRVFDPACGSGNFLVIAYKELRAIEAEINRLRGDAGRPSDIPVTNFRGIELRHFSCEIARLALIIADYQCDVLYRGQKLAMLEFLPLAATNWITCGNALRIDWLSVCPPTGKAVKIGGKNTWRRVVRPGSADVPVGILYRHQFPWTRDSKPESQ